MAGGLPLSAVTGRADVMDAAHVGGLGGTYGGNPIACAAALAALDAFEHDGLVERAQEIGTVLLDALHAAQGSDPRIGDVRGRGAMVAMELVDPATGEPDAALTGRVVRYAYEHGVIALTAGTYGNVVRFLPPLAISDELLRDGLSVVLDGLAAS